MKTQNRKLTSGFTIIEVMIVLAIAALILLVVFLAVPGLQRSQRNNARHTFVNRFASSVITFYSNTNSMPLNATDVGTIINDAGNPSGYPLAFTAASPVTTPADNKVSLNTGAQGALTGRTDSLQIVTGAKCDTPNTTGVAVAGSATQIALQYTLETSSGSAPYCQNVQ